MSEPTQRRLTLAPSQKRELRTQFGAVCWRRKAGKVEILLVTTRRTGRWVPPKGWPMGGHTPAEAAAIEAFEEAGAEGEVRDICLGIFTYTKEMDGEDLPCMVALFPLKVKRLLKDWPEKGQRKRAWFTRKKAAAKVLEPELSHLLRNFDPRLFP